MVPFAAHLAPPEQRGHLVGQVMSGLLLGIMLARTVASLLAGLWGWRTVYVVSATGAVFALAAVAMALAGLGARNLFLLAAAGVLLDLAVQGNLVLSQQEIYQLRPDARSRINTVFIGSVFFGGAIGSALSGLLYDRAGWAAVSALGVVLSIAGLGLWRVPAAARAV